MQTYTHLAKDDRNEIQILRIKGYSLRSIAKVLERSVSTISAELKRNAVAGDYTPAKAHAKATLRRKQAKYQAMKVIGCKELQDFIERELLKLQSPSAISGRLATGLDGLPYVSRNSIDRFMSSAYGQAIERQLNQLKKRMKALKKRPRSERLAGRDFIDKRPLVIANRGRIGDLEVDFIVSGKSGSGAVLTAIDRKVRYGFIRKILPVTIVNVEQALLDIQAVFPELKSLTFDNDILFRNHKQLEILLGVPIYFTEPYASWQKGSIENYNRHIRKYIPKGSDISWYPIEYLQFVEERLNDRFMGVLGYKTPRECLVEHRKSSEITRPIGPRLFEPL